MSFLGGVNDLFLEYFCTGEEALKIISFLRERVVNQQLFAIVSAIFIWGFG